MSSDHEVIETAGVEDESRRNFLVMMGWGGIVASVAGSALGAFNYIVPSVLYEPSTIFKIGKLTDYSMGITEAWKKQGGFWVVRTDAGLYALVSICRHLGCTPNWFADQQLFRCPCHGSIYDTRGNVIGGPAPRTLWRANVKVDPVDQQIIVDTAVRQDPDPVSTEKGLFVEEQGRRVAPYFIKA